MFSFMDIIAIVVTGVGIGFSMMGVSIAVLYSPFIISIYGGRIGNGIMFLPFIVADLYVTYKYRREMSIKTALKLIPFGILGMGIASMVASRINEDEFKIMLGIIILFASALYFVKKYDDKMEKVGWLFGIIGAAASYLANVSGPIFNIYFLSFKKDVKTYLGTRALFFSLLNFFKFFFYLLIFKNINEFTLLRGAMSVPFIFVGIFISKILISKISQKTFNLMVVILGIIIALKLILLS